MDVSYCMAHSMMTKELCVLPSLGVRELRLRRSGDLPQSYKDTKSPCYKLCILQSHCVARIFCSI